MHDQGGAGLTEITLVGGAQGFNWLPVFLADEQGFFADQGLKVTFKRVGGVDKATQAVLDGEAEIAITPPEGAVADFIRGGELRIVASNANRLPMSLVARPGIDSIAGLKGKKIGTSSLTEGTAIYTQMILSRAGLRYPGDYAFVLAGVHTGRWDALQKGEIDAAPQPAPWNFLAEDAGYNLLGEINAVIPEIVFAGLVGKRSWLEHNGQVVTRLLKALIKSHQLTNDQGREDLTLPIFQRITTPDNENLARRGLTYMREMGMWPDGLAIPPKALETTIHLMIGAGLLDESKRQAARGVFDPRYLDQARKGS
jgi:ABC-type nitrate/sulfonate/bicarbonate transport system substrate-binding protein